MRPFLPGLTAMAVAACSGRQPPPGTLEDLEITSANTNETYQLQVFTPDALDDEAGATVVYLFDGPENQGIVLDQYRLALDEGAEPALLVLIPGTHRVNDYTPTPNESGSNGGGQAAFMAFLMEEVAPLVEEDGAGGDPSRRVTFGHSLGGLLSATLWYDQPFASRAGIASPSMWWDEGLFFSKLAEAPRNTGPIVVACGEEEPMGMYVYTDDFSAQMRRDYGIDVTYECFDNLTHQRALEPALALTFRVLL